MPTGNYYWDNEKFNCIQVSLYSFAKEIQSQTCNERTFIFEISIHYATKGTLTLEYSV